jgi:hypothetical protein
MRFAFSTGGSAIVSMRPGGGTDIEEDQHFLMCLERAVQRAPGEVRAAERYRTANPRDGSILAIDSPDVPPAAQCIRVATSGETVRSVALEVRGAGVKSRAAMPPSRSRQARRANSRSIAASMTSPHRL